MPRTIYHTWPFDRDPTIDWILAVIRDSGLSRARVCEKSGVSLSCLRAWELGRTRRPLISTVAALARACGRDHIPLNIARGRRAAPHSTTVVQFRRTAQ